MQITKSHIGKKVMNSYRQGKVIAVHNNQAWLELPSGIMETVGADGEWEIVGEYVEPLDDWHWPFQRFNSGGDKEFACPHGVGHGGTHGCDGCCSHSSFKEKEKAKNVRTKG